MLKAVRGLGIPVRTLEDVEREETEVKKENRG